MAEQNVAPAPLQNTKWNAASMINPVVAKAEDAPDPRRPRAKP